MSASRYRSIRERLAFDRRQFLKLGGAAGAGLMLGNPAAWAADEEKSKPATNIEEALAVPRGEHALPGPFPGRVVEVHDEAATCAEGFDAAVVDDMFRRGLAALTGQGPADSFDRFFTHDDVVGIKVNPVGAGLISTRLEVVDVSPHAGD